MLKPQSCRLNIMVSNLDTAIAFYRDVLGFDLINRFGDHYAEVVAPDLLIGLHPSEKPIKIGDSLSIGIGVSHFDESVEILRNQGVTVEITQDGWAPLAHFTDPDQNALFLVERKD